MPSGAPYRAGESVHGDKDQHRGDQGADDSQRDELPCPMCADNDDDVEYQRKAGRVSAYVRAVARDDRGPEH